MTQTLAPSPKNCTCGAANLQSCLCGTTAHDWFAAAQPPVKKTPVEKRIGFITEVTKPVNDRALATIAAKNVGQQISDLTAEEFTTVADAMAKGADLGRTDRWKNACRWAINEITNRTASGEVVDAATARWAVVQGSVWMAHAAD